LSAVRRFKAISFTKWMQRRVLAHHGPKCSSASFPRDAVCFHAHAGSLKETRIYAHPKCDSSWPTFF
jgi:hypothetical protein